MPDSEYVCLILLLRLNSRKANTLAISGLAPMIMYSDILRKSSFKNLECVLELISLSLLFLLLLLLLLYSAMAILCSTHG